MQLKRFFAILGITVAACYAISVALPHDPYIRFQAFQGTMFGRLGWAYERIHYDPAPIDVLILGASREAGSLNPAYIEPALAAGGHPLHVANFSLPSSGMDIRLVLLEEVLKRKNPKVIVVSVVERLPRDGHQAFGDLATPRQLFAAPLLVNRNHPRNLARLPVRQMELAVMSADPGAFGVRGTFDPARYAGTIRQVSIREIHGDSDEAPERANLTPAELARNTKLRKVQMRAPVLPERLADVEFGLSRSSLRSIRRLAAKHDAQLVFVFLPIYDGYEMPLDADFLNSLGPILTTGEWMHDPDAYRDEGHTRTEMQPRISRWFAAELIKHMEASG